MSTIVISDVHGATFWKDAVKRAAPGDDIVFLGDYFDRRGPGPFAEGQCGNFMEICDFARTRNRTHLLIGNHDFQYTPWDRCGCSGRDERRAYGYMQAILSNMDILDAIWLGQTNGVPVIFSHAGLSSDWMNLVGIPEISMINMAFREKPAILDVWDMAGWGADRGGDDVWQSPIWIRPGSLLRSAVPGFAQVVGHTQVPGVEAFRSVHGDTIWLTCTFDGNILVLE